MPYFVAPVTLFQEILNEPLAFTVTFAVVDCNFLLFVADTALLNADFADVLSFTANTLYVYFFPYCAVPVVHEVALFFLPVPIILYISDQLLFFSRVFS